MDSTVIVETWIQGIEGLTVVDILDVEIFANSDRPFLKVLT